MIDPTGLTTYTCDALNRLTSITNNKGQVTSFTYDALGRGTSMTHANGVVTSHSYDAASQLLSLAHQLGAATINSFIYTYDKVVQLKVQGGLRPSEVRGPTKFLLTVQGKIPLPD